MTEENNNLEKLSDRVFKRSVAQMFGYEFEKQVAGLKEEYARRGILRSSSFAWAIADLILSELRSMREAFVESYLAPMQDSAEGLTDDRLPWLRTKLEGVWEPEITAAKSMLCAICDTVGLASRDVQPQVGKVEVEGRKIKLSALEDLEIALLSSRERSVRREISAPPPKPTEDLSFVNNPKFREILARDLLELATLAAHIQPKAVLMLSGGIIEGLLLDALVIAGKWNLIEGSRKSLKEMIDAAVEVTLIKQDRLSHAAREYRDLIHPGREVRENITFTSDDADIARAVVGVTIREIKDWYAKGSTP